MSKSRLLTDAEVAARAKRSRRVFVWEIFYDSAKKKADENLLLCDWARNQLHNIFFNGKSKQAAFRNIEFNSREGFFIPVKQDSTDITVADLKLAIAENLPHANPLIHSYIANYAHQGGFLYTSAAATIEKLFLNNKHMIPGQRDLHFIDNHDGTVLYIEKFAIDGFTSFNDKEQTTTIQKDYPIAMVVTTSMIKVNPNATEILKEKPDTPLKAVIDHDLVSDNILFLDTTAAHLFQEEDGHISRFYGNTAEEVDAEFLQAVNNYVDKRKKAIKPIVEFSKTEDIASSELTKTSLNSSEITQLHVAAEPILKTTSRMDHFFENQSSLSKEMVSEPEPTVPDENVTMERVSSPPQPKPIARRLSDWQFIRNTTIGFALSGLALGLSIGIAAGVLSAVPTLGLGLLAIPVFAVGGLALGAFIGLTGSALGCGLAKLTEKKSQNKSAEVVSEERKEQKTAIDNSMYKTLQVKESLSASPKQPTVAVAATSSVPKSADLRKTEPTTIPQDPPKIRIK